MAIIASDTSTGRPSESGHWYDRDGKPMYEVRAANGSMRAATLRDARKFGWVPGFSGIAQMENKPQLVNWMIEQALMAALTLPRAKDESDDAFIARAREDSKEQARKAADRGTQIHAAIQGWFEDTPQDSSLLPYVLPVNDWLAQRFGEGDWRAERSFAHPLGFGGKADLMRQDGLHVVVDFKCKDFGEEKQATELAWPEHCMQLSAYAQGFQMVKPNCVNIFVSTRVPGLIRAREWDVAEIASAWEAFQCLLKLWQIRRNYFCGFQRVAAA